MRRRRSSTESADEHDHDTPVDPATRMRKYTFSEPLLRLHTALTPDGVRLTLKHYAPRSSTPGDHTKTPVILAHGLAGNSCPFDVSKESSLAYCLLAQGYPVWLADFRGSGASDRPSKAWSLDDLIYQDLPTVIHYVRQAHGSCAQVHYIGHSLGGICILCALADATPSLQPYVKSVVTIASALNYDQSIYRFLAPLIPLARMITSDNAVLPESATPMVLSFLSLYPSMISTAKRIDKDTFASLEKSLEPVSLPVMMQLGTSIEAGGLALSPRRVEAQQRLARRRTFDDWVEEDEEEARSTGEEEEEAEAEGQQKVARFLDIMHKVRTPVLAIAGNDDVQCGEAAVMKMLDALGSVRKRFVKVGGAHETTGRTYGHMDLLLSPTAKEDVFPHVCAWLQEADSDLWGKLQEEEVEEKEEEATPKERRSSSIMSVGL